MSENSNEALIIDVQAIGAESVKNLSNALEALKNVTESLNTNLKIDKIAAEFEKLKEIQIPNTLEKNLESLSEAISKINNINVDFSSITNIHTELEKLNSFKLSGSVGRNITALVQSFSGIPNTQGIEAISKALATFSGIKISRSLGNNLGNIASAVNAIGGGSNVSGIEALVKALAAFSGIKISKTIGSNLRSIVQAVNSLGESANVVGVEAIAKALASLNGIKVSKSLGSSIESIVKAVNSLGESANVAGIETVSKALAALGGVKVNKSLGSSIESIVKSVNSLSEGANVAGVEAIAKALAALNGIKISKSVGANLESIVKTVNSLGESANTAGIETISKALAALGGIKISKSIGANLENIIQAVNSLGETANISGIETIAKALAMLNGVKISKSLGAAIYEIISNLNKLSNVKPISPQVGKNLEEVGKSLQIFVSLNGVDFSGIARLIQTLTKIGKIKPINSKVLIDNIEKIVQAINKLNDGLSHIDNKRLRALASAAKAVVSPMQETGRATNALANSLSLLNFDVLLRWAKVAVNAAKDLITNSAQAYQNLRYFNIAMGEGAVAAEQYAKKVEKVLGIPAREFMKLQTPFQSISIGLGLTNDQALIISRNLTQLSYDFAAAFGIDTETAAGRVTGALTGSQFAIKQMGVDVSNARLQQELLNLGYNKNIDSLDQATKSMLRYRVMLADTSHIQGQVARDLNQPIVQINMLSSALKELKIEIGNIFIPLLNQVLPPIIAIIRIIREFVAEVAKLFGFELPQMDTKNYGNIAEITEDISDAFDDATDSAKKYEAYLAGFDDLNVMKKPNDDSGGSGSGLSAIDIPLPEYDFFAGAVASKISEWQEKLAPFKKALMDLIPKIQFLIENFDTILKIIGSIGIALLALKISANLLSGLDKVIGLLSSAKNLGIGFGDVLAGLAIGLGVAGMITSIVWVLDDGLNIGNTLLGAVSGALIGGGVGWFITKSMSGVGLGLGIGVGLALTILAFTSMFKEGVKTKNSLLAALGGALAGGAIGFKLGGLGGAAIGLTVGASVSLLATSFISFNEGDNVTGALTGGLGAVSAVIGGILAKDKIVSLFEKLGEKVVMVTKNTGKLNTAFANGTTSLAKIGGGITLAIAGFAGLATSVINLILNWNDMDTKSKAINITLGVLGASFVALGTSIALGISTATLGIGALVAAVAGAVAAVAGLIIQIVNEESVIMSTKDSYAKLEEATENVRIADENLTEAHQNLKNAKDELKRASDDIAGSMDRYINAVENAEEAEKRLIEAEKEAGISGADLQIQVEAGTLSFKDMTETQREVYKAYIDSTLAAQDLENAESGLTEAQDALIESQNGVLEATKEIEIATEELAKAKEKETEAHWNNELALAAAEKDYESFRDAVIDAFEKGELSAEEAQELISKSMVKMSDKARETYTKDIPDSINEGLDPKKYETKGEKLENFFKNTWDNICEWAFDIKESFELIGEWFDETISEIESKVTGFFSKVWGKITGFFSNIWEEITGFFDKAKTKIIEFKDNVGKWFKEIGEKIVNGLENGLQILLDLPKKLFGKFIKKIKELFGIHSPSTVFIGIGGNIIDGLIDGIGNLLDLGKLLVKKLISGFLDFGSAFVEIGGSIKDGIVNGVTGIGDTFVEVGNNVASGFKKGVSSVASGASKAFNGVVSGVTSIFDINSPSKVFEKIGEYVSAGLAIGIKSKLPESVKAFESLTDIEPLKITPEISLGTAINPPKLEIEPEITLGTAISIPKVEIEPEITLNNVSENAEKTKTALQASFKKLGNIGINFVGDLISGEKDIKEEFSKIGENASEGFKEGVSKITTLAKSIFNKFTGGAKEALDEHSPSKVFEEIGKYVGDGLAIGINSSLPKSINAIESISDTPIPKISPEIAFLDNFSNKLTEIKEMWKNAIEEMSAMGNDFIDGMVMPDLSFEKMKETVSADISTKGEVAIDTEEIITAVMQASQIESDLLLQLIETVSNQNTDIYMDGRKVTDIITKRISNRTQTSGRQVLLV